MPILHYFSKPPPRCVYDSQWMPTSEIYNGTAQLRTISCHWWLVISVQYTILKLASVRFRLAQLEATGS